MNITPAIPKASLGQKVGYIDHHGRYQTGEIIYIEAKWASVFKSGPHLTYCVEHPTYRNRRHYTSTVHPIGEHAAMEDEK